MGARFTHWLARPSSLCFLRRVLATTGEPVPRQFHVNARRCSQEEAIAALRGIESHEDTSQHDGNYHSHSQSKKSRAVLVEESVGLRRRNDKDDGHENNSRDAEKRRRLNETSLEEVVYEPMESDIEATTDPAFQALWSQHNLGQRPTLSEVMLKRDDMKHWVEHLQVRQRLDGFAGVQEVWKGMRFRQIDLPVDGPEADLLWSTLLQVSIVKATNQHRKALYDSVLEHAKDLYVRRGLVWSGLYKCLVGGWLRQLPSQAVIAHRFLVGELNRKPPLLKDLADDFAASLEPRKARKHFRVVYRDSGPQEGLYDSFIPAILARHGDLKALGWHRYFLREGIGPSNEIFALPEVQRLFELDNDESLPMVHRHKRRGKPSDLSTPPPAAAPVFPPLTRANMSMLVGEVHGIKPKEISDTFVARLFATQAFSLGFIIKGIGILGVNKLGPLALHEMALRAKSAEDFRQRIIDLKTMGISCDSSIYGRLALKIATEGPPELFSALLASDQHPEAYDDVRAQEMLLTSFLEKHDSLNAELTFLGLSLGGSLPHARAWNRLLQLHIQQQDYLAMIRTFRQIRDSRMKLSMRTLTFIHRGILPQRNAGRAPVKTAGASKEYQPLQFATNVYMHAAEARLYVSPLLWIELLKRYGMTDRWDECERLVCWLMSWYGQQHPASGTKGPTQFGREMLKRIFGPHMQKALIHWSMRYAGHRRLLRRGLVHTNLFSGINSPRCEQWARGLLLVKQMEESGIPVSHKDIRHALVLRLLSLFGPAFSNKRINEEIRTHNQLTLADFIKHANEVCKVNLFSVDPALLSPKPPYPAELMIHIFSSSRRIGKHGYADIAGYARVMETSDDGYQRMHVRHKRGRWILWAQSAFRLSKRKRTPLRILDDISVVNKAHYNIKRLVVQPPHNATPRAQPTPTSEYQPFMPAS